MRPLTRSEIARIGGQARAAKLTPERRAEISRKAYLAGAVERIVAAAPELTPDQLDRLRTIFSDGR